MADCGQYYKCVSPGSYTGITSAIVLGIVSGTIAIVALIAALAGSAIPGLGVVAALFLIGAVIALCAYISGGKLVCIGEDACTIGRIMETTPPTAADIDDDFTLNTLPSPHSPVETRDEVTATEDMIDPKNPGQFLMPQRATTGIGLPWGGHSVQFENLHNNTEVLHVEVKGCRIHDLCIVWKAMSIGAAVVAVICMIPGVGWFICLIAALILMVITALATLIAWAATHSGNVNDVYDPASGELKSADPQTGEGGDVILIRGDWVYDAWHSGWNEIQPIRFIQKLTDCVPAKYQLMVKADATLVADFKKEILDPWCFYVGQASDPLTKAAQDEPANRWHIHPSIDGCQEPTVIG